MIAHILLSAQFIAVAAEWIPCEQWNPNVHCTFTGKTQASECGTNTCVITQGGMNPNWADGGHVCDNFNEVYKNLYLNRDVLAAHHLTPDNDNTKSFYEIDDPSCFDVVNEPNSALFQDCWSYKGKFLVESENEDDADTLDECKTMCLDDAACVGVSYTEQQEPGVASPIGGDAICYVLHESEELNDPDEDAGSHLFRRIPCYDINALIVERQASHK